MSNGYRTKSGGSLSADSPIPNKLYFKIGEVSALVGVQAHVLRYWEKESSCIRPSKTASNQRRYRKKDIELFRRIRHLLYDKKFTLAGARKQIQEMGDQTDTSVSASNVKMGWMREKSVVTPIAIERDAIRGDVPAPKFDRMSLPLGEREALRGRIENVRRGLRELIQLASGEIA